MSGDIAQFLQEQKLLISEDKKRLGLCQNNKKERSPLREVNCDKEVTQNNNCEQSLENKENVQLNSNCVLSPNTNKTLPFVEPLDLNSKRDSNDVSLEGKKQVFIDKLVSSENPFTNRSDDSVRSTMLRYGEYSPNNPQLRVAAAPYLGLGEYEQRRNYFLQKQRADYLRHLAKQSENIKIVSRQVSSNRNEKARCLSEKSDLLEKNEPMLAYCEKSKLAEKSVQTDIQNIKSRLIQYELQCQDPPEKELNPHRVVENNYSMQNNRNTLFRVDQRLTSAQNALLNTDMDKPKSILSNRRTVSPRERISGDLYPNSSFMDGFSYQESRAEEHERERLKRDAYQRELRLQIEEKRRLQQMRDEQERREQELENKRLEQQLLRMQEERAMDEQRRSRRDEQMRRHSEDLLRRRQDFQSRHGYRKHTDSESSVTSCLRNNPTDLTSKSLSHYSPPVSRRNPYSLNIPSTSVFSEPPSSRYNPSRFDSYSRRDAMKRMDSLNSYDTTPSRHHQKFSRFDSLSRIDSLSHRMESMNFRDGAMSDGQRRHSATHQDLTASRKSPRLQRRSSSSRFDDSLPVPVLKAHSPVARELKNSVPFSSSRHNSDAVRRLEDRWQTPAVQKNLVNHTDSFKEGQNRSILTQLGAIRMQLQQEQMRMDESLRKRDITQSKAVDFN